MEDQVTGCVSRKKDLCKKMRKKAEIFEQEKQKFMREQEEKVNILKKYLDDKLAAIQNSFENQTLGDKNEINS